MCSFRAYGFGLKDEEQKGMDHAAHPAGPLRPATQVSQSIPGCDPVLTTSNCEYEWHECVQNTSLAKLQDHMIEFM